MLTNEDSNLFICQPTLYTLVTFTYRVDLKKENQWSFLYIKLHNVKNGLLAKMAIKPVHNDFDITFFYLIRKTKAPIMNVVC